MSVSATPSLHNDWNEGRKRVTSLTREQRQLRQRLRHIGQLAATSDLRQVDWSHEWPLDASWRVRETDITCAARKIVTLLQPVTKRLPHHARYALAQEVARVIKTAFDELAVMGTRRWRRRQVALGVYMTEAAF
jgi:hypothetical protein